MLKQFQIFINILKRTVFKSPSLTEVLDLNWKKSTFKGSVRKNEKGPIQVTAKNKRFWSLLILILSVASIRRKLLNTTHAEETEINISKSNSRIIKIKNIMKFDLYTNASKISRWLLVVISEWFVWNSIDFFITIRFECCRAGLKMVGN